MSPTKNVSYASAFAGLLLRDLRVMRRELGPFIVRVVMQPLLFLFVFTYVFPRIGQAERLAEPISRRCCCPA